MISATLQTLVRNENTNEIALELLKGYFRPGMVVSVSDCKSFALKAGVALDMTALRASMVKINETKGCPGQDPSYRFVNDYCMKRIMY